MRRWQWLILILAIIALAAVEHHNPTTTPSAPSRGTATQIPTKYATIQFVDENGNPLDVNVVYMINGAKKRINGNGTVKIPETADYAIAYAKGRIPVKITAIVDGRRVVVPTDPTTEKRTLSFKGCAHVFIAPKPAPLVTEYNCNTEIALPEGVYHYAATDKNGCIIAAGVVTLRENKAVETTDNAKCRRVPITVEDAESGKSLRTMLTVFEENTDIAHLCDGNCEVGVPENGADVYAWLPGYLRGYTHIYQDKNAEILLNKAVSGEYTSIRTDGNQIVVTDRDGVVIYHGVGADANIFLPDGSYYVFAERGPIVTKVFMRIPGNQQIRISIQPEDAIITLKPGEVLYVNDVPTCHGPATCKVPALTALRIIFPDGKQKIFVALPGEERII
ncbi:MAG: hypothetical protein GXN93_02970 [Candidatus Diapherotrites archaeon]|nr:hypothetical protein [Candidatus Diapherotrites archaeon]